MNAKEALRVLTRGMEGGNYEDIGMAFCHAMNSLAAEVAREEKEKRPSLEALEAALRRFACPAGIRHEFDVSPCCEEANRLNLAAANVLKVVREVVVPQLQREVAIEDGGIAVSRTFVTARQQLRALGEQG